MLVEESFEMSEATFGIEKEVADEGNARAGLKLEGQGGGDRCSGLGARRGLEVNIVIRQLRVLFWRGPFYLGVLGVLLFYFPAFFLGMMGAFMSARSEGFTPLTSPPKLNELGL